MVSAYSVTDTVETLTFYLLLHKAYSNNCFKITENTEEACIVNTNKILSIARQWHHDTKRIRMNGVEKKSVFTLDVYANGVSIP